MIEFAIYWDGWASHLAQRAKIALRYDGRMLSLDAVEVFVPMRSLTGEKPSFQMVGIANTIDVVDGKATIK
jgi:hypothetical protein